MPETCNLRAKFIKPENSITKSNIIQKINLNIIKYQLIINDWKKYKYGEYFNDFDI